ncbi:MAG: sulfur carrier protein ThiS [Kiritimatiellia bacterium]|nr:sulfur carrier protein ThiS [Kiritimatiellia bacterium]MDP6848712.1 sulfur carrier protein ThiS [Kiritimatiellia bacterium]
MQIEINGEGTAIDDGLNVASLLKVQDVKMPDMVSVELNDEILEREDFETTTLKEGDRVELLYFMGGGALPEHGECGTGDWK